MTWVTWGMSRPRAATSVATSTGVLPDLKDLRACSHHTAALLGVSCTGSMVSEAALQSPWLEQHRLQVNKPMLLLPCKAKAATAADAMQAIQHRPKSMMQPRHELMNA